MDIKILVAAHKEANMPADSIYLPLHVGATGKESIGFTRDDSGENISDKNPLYCELTGVYWAWKNCKCDVIGLVHYRRFFGKKNKEDFYQGVINSGEIQNLLKKYDVILAKPRNYYIEDISTHFHNHLKVFTDIDYIDYLEKTVSSLYPEYLEAYRKCFRRTKGHMCNMFIMRWADFDKYCTWLFSILETMEAGHSNYTKSEQMPRIYGFIGELLLDVYVEYNQLKYFEQGTIELNTQSFMLKAFNFCKRKFLGIR